MDLANPQDGAYMIKQSPWQKTQSASTSRKGFHSSHFKKDPTNISGLSGKVSRHEGPNIDDITNAIGNIAFELEKRISRKKTFSS